jgi:hypothetical protein
VSNQTQNFYVSQFGSNVQIMLQQRQSRLATAVKTGNHVGDQASAVDQIFAVTANKQTQRFAPITRTDAQTDRRWVAPVDYDLAQMVDSFDKLRLLMDPMSEYVQNAASALGRAKDLEIISAFFGSSMTGVKGASPTAFSTNLTTAGTPGQVVSVLQGSSSASGLSVAKLREAKRCLMANEVDLASDPVYMAITAKQHDDLLSEVQVIDADFNGGKPVLEDGLIMRFLGINFIHTELLTTGTDDNSGTSTACPLWAKSGMYLGMWNDLNINVSQRIDLTSQPYQAYVKGSFGATRLDEKRVVKVWCR